MKDYLSEMQNGLNIPISASVAEVVQLYRLMQKVHASSKNIMEWADRIMSALQPALSSALDPNHLKESLDKEIMVESFMINAIISTIKFQGMVLPRTYEKLSALCIDIKNGGDADD
jgi:hypothetical protein